ncbi:hypothetical protein B0H14DRAFT_3444497 [Mycena olivaceomarginata]|nr:hypothetical protein B0H14DRAFT_3444497 [Mycena olivaceomarginata]
MDPSDYFSDLPPTITTFNVEEIPTPLSIVVKALGRSYLCNPKIKSIVLVHSPAHRAKADRYPVWLATIWSSMESVREARTLWRAVDQVNGRLKNSAIDDAATERARAAIQALDLLPWDGAIKGFKGGTISDLADWFTTDYDGSTSCIQNTYFVKALAEACSDPEKYRTAHKFGWLRRLGASFATKDRTRLGTIANKNENH